MWKRKEKALTGQHVHVGTVGDAENMGWDFITTLANVHLDDTVGVDGEALVRVDGHAKETGVGLFLFCFLFFVEKLIRITNSLASFSSFLIGKPNEKKEEQKKTKN